MARRRLLALFALLIGLSALAGAEPEMPPGINIHLVSESDNSIFWRGAAPRPDTLQALLKSAQERHVKVMLIDLRHPANADDCSGKSGRLSPQGESQMCRELGIGYTSISALDSALIPTLREALERGDVYIHCMYGVNRTGFAVGRYATAGGLTVDRDKLGKRDWEQGVRFQQRVRK